MSFDEGMKLFRSGDVPGACEQFHQAVEQDENNHKAWNALGICLSKSGEHEDADTCFENALMLDPGNSTYERNRERNSLKIPIRRPEKKPVEPVRTNTRKEYDSGYQRNWFQIPLYFIPMILAIANPVIGFLAVIACAYYIKRDAESLNAGMNPDASMWGKMKGWEWMLLLVLFWILLPLYSWKREQIYEENLGCGSDYYLPQPSGLPLGKIVVGVFAVFFILFSLVFVAGMAGSVSHSAASSTGNSNTFQPTQQVTSAPITKPVVKQPVNTATLGERSAAKKALSYLKFTNFSYSGLVKQLEYEGFSHAEAVYGVDKSGADWNEQAAGKAKSYLEFSSFSRERLIEQLEYEGFTRSQAEYGAQAVGY